MDNYSATSATPESQPQAQETPKLASKAKDMAMGTVKTQLSTQKDRFADSLAEAGDILRQTGKQFADRGSSTFSQYTNSAAERLTALGSYMSERDVDQMMRDTGDFARRRPGVFLGGAFIAGVLAARFMKSSSHSAGYTRS